MVILNSRLGVVFGLVHAVVTFIAFNMADFKEHVISECDDMPKGENWQPYKAHLKQIDLENPAFGDKFYAK